jgi:hypothetical protein
MKVERPLEVGVERAIQAIWIESSARRDNSSSVWVLFLPFARVRLGVAQSRLAAP